MNAATINQIHLSLITALEDAGVTITSDVNSVTLAALKRAQEAGRVND